MPPTIAGPADADLPADGPDETGARSGLARHWGIRAGLSSILGQGERFLAARPFDRGPWLATGFAGGIATWLVLDGPWHWLALIGACAGLGVLARLMALQFGYLGLAVTGMALMIAAGCATVWVKSALVGRPGIARPMLVTIEGGVIDRVEQPAEQRVRLLLNTHLPDRMGLARVRINVPVGQDRPGLAEGAIVKLRARLMPPAPPMLPGSYDFARAAWFQGLAATGAAIGSVEIMRPARDGGLLRRWQRALAAHVRARLSDTPGAIAAAFASGDRGAIARDDEDAMRDAGLTHLLSISGLHVSAVVAAVYFLAVRLLGVIPYVALRLRLPLVGAAAGALAGIAYTLLTGAEVPTVRSCLGALLVLAALALGRDPLSLRLLAVAAFVVMLFWPEAVYGPSFQMSFASVIAIVAFHSSLPARRFLARRDESAVFRFARQALALLLTGVVIELALMPIGLFHFHRAGLYGAAANVVAIPLTTFVTMPLIALALVLDLAGWGAPAWWLAGKSLDLLLWLAHTTARQPGAVTMMPTMQPWIFGLFCVGGLWLALWTGRARLFGLAPVLLAIVAFAMARPPDVLISGDGRHVGITGEGPELLVLRLMRGDYARDNLLETAGMTGDVRPLDQWPGARCNADMCRALLVRGGRRFTLLMTRSDDLVDAGELVIACRQADLVVADRRLPRACQPRLLKADRSLLARTGGLAIDLASGRVRTVAETQGHHGWWRPLRPRSAFGPNARRIHAPTAEDGRGSGMVHGISADRAGQITPHSRIPGQATHSSAPTDQGALAHQ